MLHGFNCVGSRTSEALYVVTEKERRGRRIGICCRHSRIGVGCGARTMWIGWSWRRIGIGGGGLQCRRWKMKPKKLKTYVNTVACVIKKAPREAMSVV